MSKAVWKTPAPSSGFMRGVQFGLKPQRICVLSFEYEDEDEEMRNGELSFTGVVEYRATFMPALRVDQISECYDQLIELEDSADLKEAIRACEANQRKASLKHYRICFDDGPSFDMLCEGFEWNNPSPKQRPPG